MSFVGHGPAEYGNELHSRRVARLRPIPSRHPFHIHASQRLEVLAARLADEMDDVSKNLARLNKRLDDERFLSRAPEEVVDRERERLAASQQRRDRIEETLAKLGGPPLP